MAFALDGALVLQTGALPRVMHSRGSEFLGEQSWYRGEACNLGSREMVITQTPLHCQCNYWSWRKAEERINDKAGGAPRQALRQQRMRGVSGGVNIKMARQSSSSSTGVEEEESSMSNYMKTWEEEMGKIRRLQNGSDIRGVAVAGERGREVNLTPAAAFYLGASFGEWVQAQKKKQQKQQQQQQQQRDVDRAVRVSLGRDPRISGPSLLTATAAGLQSVGCSVVDMGLATTPACFMSTILPGFQFDASIMLTASHLPYTRNGLKLFTSDGGLNVSDIESICNVAALNYVKFPSRCANVEKVVVEKVEFMLTYSEHLRNIIKKGVNHPTDYDHPLKGFKVVVNAGNGSGGFFARDVLEKLGADTSASVNLEPDGMFPNHTPNPEDRKAMEVTRGAVLGSGADLGVVFDTDVDRSGVVDGNGGGNVINGDRLIALMAAIVLAEHPASVIVTDARTSDGLSKFIADRGGTHCLYRVGYRNVINKGIQLNQLFGADTHLMMETSGHGALKENYFLDDGAYMAVKIVIEMVRMRLGGSHEGIGGLIKDLEEPQDNVELRVNILSRLDHVKRRGGEVIESFRRFVVDGDAPAGWTLSECGDCWVSDGCLADFDEGQNAELSHNVNYQPPDGIDAHMYRAQIYDDSTGASGWVHMRQSIHNPNFAINMQSLRRGGCYEFAKVLLERFFHVNNNAHELDIGEIEAFVAQNKELN